MKPVLRIGGILLSIPLLGLVGFYLWASAGRLPADRYSDIVAYPAVLPPDTDNTFTVVTYNIGYGSGLTNNQSVTRSRQLFDQNLASAATALKALQPDLLGLQEVDVNSRRSFNVNQVAVLAETLGLDMGAIAINWDKRYLPFPYWPISAQFGPILSGQAVLSRYPIKSNQRTVLERVAGEPFYRRAFYLDRLVQITQIDLNGQPLVLMNVHLEAFDAPTRLRQTEAVRQLAEQYGVDYPVLLVGDFNSAPATETDPEASIMPLLQAPDLQAAVPFDRLDQPTSPTFPSDQPVLQLDNIFYTPAHIQALEARVVPEVRQASDHLPVMLKFRLIPGPG